MSAIDRAEAGSHDPPGNGRNRLLQPECVLLPRCDRTRRAMMDVYDKTVFGHLVEERAVNGCGVTDYVP